MTTDIFRLSSQTAIEKFDDGVLLLHLKNHKLLKVTERSHYALSQTDGQRSLTQVATIMAETLQISEADAQKETLAMYKKLSAQGFIELVNNDHNNRENNMEQTTIAPQYIRNPDVVLREEDEDGGLVFNPDTNQVKVLNTTGLFIWQQCDGTHDIDGVVTALKDVFQDAPEDEVAQDVREFVDGMVSSGFIGTKEQ